MQRAWDRLDTIALAAVTASAAILRLIRLDIPKDWIFDEVYYAKDACLYLNLGNDFCASEGLNEVHPPLGKWIIAVGIKLFGYDSFGWRVMAALAGAATVALLFLLARRILNSTLGATLAGGLLAVDPLHFVQSRTSMLDVFIPLFAVAAFLCIVIDDQTREQRSGVGLFSRPWLIAAGLSAGGAIAVKWSAVFVWLAVILFSLVWEVRARRHEDEPRPYMKDLSNTALWLIAAPLFIYVISYIGRVDGTLLAVPWAEDSWMRGIWEHQFRMADFHFDLESTHSYQSPAWSWILLKRPVSYAFCAADKCNPDIPADYYKEILATGSPFVWWASILALCFVAYHWIRRRDSGGAAGLIAGGFLLTYLPWALLDLASPRSATFLFYLLPIQPFMLLALGYVAVMIGRSWEARAAIALFSAGAVALFVFYYPVLSYVAIPQSQWDQRIWIFDRCDKPAGKETTEISTETSKGRTTTRTEVKNTNENLPPTGWCWI
jgi:dolichyl-phosphate-mannose-protein mannosyltransferase